MHIEVKVDEASFPPDRSGSRYLKNLVAFNEAWYNCGECFDETERINTAIHEAGHYIYAGLIGGNPRAEGPMISYDALKKTETARQAAVVYTIPAGTRALPAIKVSIASFIFVETLTGSHDSQIVIDGDLQKAHVHFDKRAESGDSFDEILARAEWEIRTDLRDPEFRQFAWQVAWQIQDEIFGHAPATVCEGHILNGVRQPSTGMRREWAAKRAAKAASGRAAA